MMMPSMTSSFSSSSSSSPSATVRVDKATSEFLIGPDWTLNMEICDTINSNQLLAKDVVKAVKKRLQHKNPKVQLLALTLLEAMVKNCGDYVHFQITERNILQEMIKIVKKKADMHVRDKILTLLDSWQEAFGGPGGKYPQYYWACDELRRYGVEFPPRSYDTVPILTPPVAHQTPRHPQPGYGMPINSSIRLDEAMATETENLSLLSIISMRDVADLLSDMLQAVDPSDRSAVKDEVIIDLVERCRANQKNLMQMLSTTGDEELLAQGLELNDTLQNLLAKHDAIASGSPLSEPIPSDVSHLSEKHDMSPKPDEVGNSNSTLVPSPSAPKGQVDEDEDKEDDFAQLARRHSKPPQPGSQSRPANVHSGTSPGVASTSSMSNALVLSDPPPPVRTTKEQDIMELLSLTLSADTSTPRTPQTSTPSGKNVNHTPVSSTGMGNPYNSQVFNSYIAPWAQAQPQPHPQPQHQFHPEAKPHPHPQHQFLPEAQPHTQPQYQFQPQAQPPFQPQAQLPAQTQNHFQPQPLYQPQQTSVKSQHQVQLEYMQHASAYPPPPWAPTPGYLSNTSTIYQPYAQPAPQTSAISSMPLQGTKSLQHVKSFPTRTSNGSVPKGEVQFSSSPRISNSTSGPKPFIPSYRLFEDLNVLGNIDGRQNATNNSSPSLSEARNQNMFGERK